MPNGASQLVILHEIDLAVMAGEAVAIVGASGSGKSTLLGLLAGLDTPSGAACSWTASTCSRWARTDVRHCARSCLASCSSLSSCLPALNALENVMLPLELAGTAGAAQRAAAMMARVGLGERLAHYPKYLSGGEQQRVRWRAHL